jgi:DNA-binding SARP family transcriptional activator
VVPGSAGGEAQACRVAGCKSVNGRCSGTQAGDTVARRDANGAMDYRILGRLEVADGEQILPLRGSRQRALLAVLLINRRQVVSLDRLTEQLWDGSPPLSAAKTIQVYVSRLRKVLGASAVETVGRGYRLAVSPDQVDVDGFDALVGDGRAALRSGDTASAIDRLGAALALCPAQPLEEFVCEAFAEAEIERLTEARLAALEDRVEGELQAGGGPELVGELERSVAEHPLRERLVAGLMLALYRAGRHSEALAAYRAARTRLVEGLGLEPGPELRDLERRILDHDPSLAAHRRPASTASTAAVPDYPEPSAYLPQFFGCTGGDSNGYYCDPRLDNSMRRATADNLRDPEQAGREWTSVDRQLTQDAPWVPTVNLRQVDLVSSRLRNFQYNPVWGFLVDQSWLGGDA